MANDNYKSIVSSAFIDILKQFRENPYYYFYEEDIRVDLAQKLIKESEQIEVTHPHSHKKILTTPIKCEYPGNQQNNNRHDIVFVQRNSFDNIYILDIPVIIELKLGSKSYDRCSEFKEDIKKLLGYKYNHSINLGIAVYFYQDEVESKLFDIWFRDIIEKFKKVEMEKITFDSPDSPLINSFIVTPDSILWADTYINY
jgi:hypothetical protein